MKNERNVLPTNMIKEIWKSPLNKFIKANSEEEPTSV